MKIFGGISFVVACLLASSALANEPKAQCIENVSAAAEAAGEQINAEKVCTCLKDAMDEDPTLLEELTAAGGLPGPDNASDAFKEVFKGCRASAS